ncbi:MAG: hypothetical protein EXR55_02510 [Dehalococcoidia bacterium]|nr:hypothetical protein [Dehalococcoidia bacterium]
MLLQGAVLFVVLLLALSLAPALRDTLHSAWTFAAPRISCSARDVFDQRELVVEHYSRQCLPLVEAELLERFLQLLPKADRERFLDIFQEKAYQEGALQAIEAVLQKRADQGRLQEVIREALER